MRHLDLIDRKIRSFIGVYLMIIGSHNETIISLRSGGIMMAIDRDLGKLKVSSLVQYSKNQPRLMFGPLIVLPSEEQ